MSNIYEALRRAEMDRANSADAPANANASPSAAPASIQTTRVAVQSSAALQGVASLPTAASRATGSSVLKADSGRASMEPIALPITVADVADLLDDSSAIDLVNIPQVVWIPAFHQLPALEQRGSSVEQFRSLRSRIQQFRDRNPLKSILVSSGLSQEGKSFVAVNLAVSLARHKASRVLLIDGDMRRSSLHKLLGAPEGPGLTEYLSGRATLTQVMQRPKPGEDGHPLPLGLASLVFIPGGDASDKAADLSGNHRFNRLIADVAPYFDWIVVDSSPVNLISDAVNLARACDGVLLVARGGTTRYESAQRAVAELKASNILGFVLNAIEDPPSTVGYDSYN
jgi:capsular exopolysaccharide synthesis family protein